MSVIRVKTRWKEARAALEIDEINAIKIKARQPPNGTLAPLTALLQGRRRRSHPQSSAAPATTR
jgi:hypothetical protein